MKKEKYVMFINDKGVVYISKVDDLQFNLDEIVFKLYFKGVETNSPIKYKVKNEINVGDVYAQYQSDKLENVEVIKVIV